MRRYLEQNEAMKKLTDSGLSKAQAIRVLQKAFNTGSCVANRFVVRYHPTTQTYEVQLEK